MLVWWLIEPHRLRKAQTEVLMQAEADDQPLGVSAISLWELARLVAAERVAFDDPLDVVLDGIERRRDFAVISLDARVALETTRLSGRMSNDPADRLIVATARVHGLRLVTADERIRKSGDVAVV
jgi:PIN domain nuclease of toxin-antitoxin system